MYSRLTLMLVRRRASVIGYRARFAVLDLLRRAIALFAAMPVAKRPASADPSTERAPATRIEHNRTQAAPSRGRAPA